MKTRDEILNNLQNVNSDEVEKYTNKLTEYLFKHRVNNWSSPIGCDLTDYNEMLAQSIVSRLQSLGYYAKYSEKSSPWRYFVTISVYPIKEENNTHRCIFSIFKKSLFNQ